MRLVSFETAKGKSYGIALEGGIVDAKGRLDAPDLKAAVATGGLPALKGLAGLKPDYREDEVTYLPPIEAPEKVICVGLNYHAHLVEVGWKTKLEHPMLFTRFANSHVGHNQPLIRPRVSECFDYEGELAVVIGKRGRHVPASSAFDIVLGYSCYNEGTIRDWVSHSPQVTPGKNFPAIGSFGPWIVTQDEIPDPKKLTLCTRLNGVEMQRAPISDMVFDIPALIAYCTTFTELAPGDVICTGNPPGSGAFRKPPVWLKPGDKLEIDITSIGVLSNPVIME